MFLEIIPVIFFNQSDSFIRLIYGNVIGVFPNIHEVAFFNRTAHIDAQRPLVSVALLTMSYALILIKSIRLIYTNC